MFALLSGSVLNGFNNRSVRNLGVSVSGPTQTGPFLQLMLGHLSQCVKSHHCTFYTDKTLSYLVSHLDSYCVSWGNDNQNAQSSINWLTKLNFYLILFLYFRTINHKDNWTTLEFRTNSQISLRLNFTKLHLLLIVSPFRSIISYLFCFIKHLKDNLRRWGVSESSHWDGLLPNVFAFFAFLSQGKAT